MKWRHGNLDVIPAYKWMKVYIKHFMRLLTQLYINVMILIVYHVETRLLLVARDRGFWMRKRGGPDACGLCGKFVLVHLRCTLVHIPVHVG